MYDVVYCVDHVAHDVVIVDICCYCDDCVHGELMMPRLRLVLCVDMLAESYGCYGGVVVVLLCG